MATKPTSKPAAKPVSKGKPSNKPAAKPVEAAPQEDETQAVEETQVEETQAETVFVNLFNVASAYAPDFTPQGAKESDQDFIGRILEAMSKLPEKPVDIYEDMLSDEAKAWCGTAGEQWSAEKPVDVPDGFVAHYNPDGATEAPAAEEKPASKGKAGKPASKPAATAEDGEKKELGFASKRGVIDATRKLILGSYDAKTGKLPPLADLKPQMPNVNSGTWSVQYSWCRACLTTLKELGMLKGS